MDALDDLVDLDMASKDLGLAPVTLRAAIKAGRLRGRKFGKVWVTTKVEVERYRTDWLGRLGRPPQPPIVYGFVPWPDGAYETKTLLLGSLAGIDEDVREIQREIAARAIGEGAWQLAEVIVKLQTDSRLRDFTIRGDPRAPTLIVDRTPITSQFPQDAAGRLEQRL